MGRADDLRALLYDLSIGGVSGRAPFVAVLHGPPGVGKSALAAVMARWHGDEQRRQSGEDPLPVHWLGLGGTVDVQGTLLRLLAECGAPREPIVHAATAPERVFRRLLRYQCAKHIRERVVVLDDVSPSAARPLLKVLRGCVGLTVIVTSDQKRGWRGVDLLHRVWPLSGREATELFSRYPETHSVAAPSAALGLPSLVRIAGALAHEVPREELLGATRPDALVQLALHRCTPEERLLLETLASRPSRAPFTTLTIWPLDRRNAMAGLVQRGLVQQPREAEDVFLLPAPVREAVLGRPPAHVTPPDELVLELAGAATRLVDDSASLLDGRPRLLSDDKPLEALSPHEFAAHIDEFMRLLADTRRLRAKYLEDLFINALATVLAFLGDAHRLVALHRGSRKNSAVRRALCAVARGVGLPDVAQSLIDGDTTPHAIRERAANHHAAGHLDSALAALGTAPEAEDIHAAWNLLVRGAVLCDQGKVEEAARHLRFSADLHRAFDCRRGHGQALLQLARVSLLRGLNAEADELLGQAEVLLSALGDVRGQNWIETERVRLQAQRGDTEEACLTAERTIAAHKAAGDVRGVGWTEFWLGHALWGDGHHSDAEYEWQEARECFSQCWDALGHAWARHRVALVPPDRLPWREDPVAEWLSVHQEFVETGCTHGRAWATLEIAARVPGPAMSSAFLSTAQSDFRTLDDVAGLSWVSAVRIARDHTPPPPDARARLTESLPDRPWATQLIQDIERFWDTPFNGLLNEIPPHARDLVLTTSTPDVTEEDLSPHGPRCRVRITLLDESPTTGTTARLLLRVSPEPGHTWAADPEAAPWLTATALPLTRASLEPPSAHLRPSHQAGHGAEFDFTPHRTGTHRIRFTIALERTGTVLQQVETELDILDNDQPGSHAAPHSVIPRGR
ncbi:hypothetical protein BN159_3435 [Streptomyces davaonensis JCM 4913]|uniref:AAA+ ATPase domain-containing protein n=1 Tax=Streptomyces davaonensis (strain DSM 101723 / JCM 4913 / KCC S-0913 / 768) TaxID=1214101 RepID=K4R552_STRDJ|nr:ATP-binding protein [Streptomyces davaonensis]CCK27814.1 hypothetical protein BN159_3435 [Streptomyces davaonensis JCM 4913]